MVGNALFAEYEDVLAREAIFVRAAIGVEDRAALLDAFLAVCEWISIAYLWRPNLRDEADNHLVELAVAGNADWIVSGNRADLLGGELRFDRIRIGTPQELLAALAKED